MQKDPPLSKRGVSCYDNNKMKIFDVALDLFFPKYCFGCGADDIWLCEVCQKKIIIRKSQLCPYCSAVSELGKFCKNCKKGALSGLLVATYYEPPVDRLIHGFKYQFVRELAPLFADFVKPNIEQFKEKYTNPIIIPVPLYKSRLLWRGFNQSEEIAKIISKRLNLPISNCLKRTKNTKPQVELKREARLENPHGAFTIKNSEEIKDKTILLIDDIATTLATLETGASELKKAGARRVWGCVVARGK